MSFSHEEYKIKIELLQPMLGTVTQSKSIFAAHIASKMAKDLKKEGFSKDEIQDEIASTLDGVPDDDVNTLGLTSFYRTDTFDPDQLYRKPDFSGYFLRDYQIKGFFKEAARSMKEHGKLKQLRDKVARYLFINPWAIKLAELDQELPIVERPLRAQTPQGERVAIARSHAIAAGHQIEFQLVAKADFITANLINDLLAYGESMGLMQNRGAGYGQFRVIQGAE